MIRCAIAILSVFLLSAQVQANTAMKCESSEFYSCSYEKISPNFSTCVCKQKSPYDQIAVLVASAVSGYFCPPLGACVLIMGYAGIIIDSFSEYVERQAQARNEQERLNKARNHNVRHNYNGQANYNLN